MGGWELFFNKIIIGVSDKDILKIIPKYHRYIYIVFRNNTNFTISVLISRTKETVTS